MILQWSLYAVWVEYHRPSGTAEPSARSFMDRRRCYVDASADPSQGMTGEQVVRAGRSHLARLAAETGLYGVEVMVESRRVVRSKASGEWEPPRGSAWEPVARLRLDNTTGEMIVEYPSTESSNADNARAVAQLRKLADQLVT